MYALTEDGIDITETTGFENIPLDMNNADYIKVLDKTNEEGTACWEGGTIPAQVQTDAATRLFNVQLWAYRPAKARLEQYQVAVGQPEIINEVSTGETTTDPDTGQVVPVYSSEVVQGYIPPVPATIEVHQYAPDGSIISTETIENPLITKDNAERAEAQAISDATPQDVKDAA